MNLDFEGSYQLVYDRTDSDCCSCPDLNALRDLSLGQTDPGKVAEYASAHTSALKQALLRKSAESIMCICIYMYIRILD